MHAEMVQLSDQGVTGLGDEESTAIGWLTAAVQKCARARSTSRAASRARSSATAAR